MNPKLKNPSTNAVMISKITLPHSQNPGRD
jgi:hypothetical protein